MRARKTSLATLTCFSVVLAGCETCESRHRGSGASVERDAAAPPLPSPVTSPEPVASLPVLPEAGMHTPSETEDPSPTGSVASSEPDTSDAVLPPTPPPLPHVDEPQHVVGAWGDVQEISGTALLGTLPSSAVISVGDGLRLPHDDSAVVSWSETKLQFRVPFPHQGEIFVETNEGRVAAGSFESEWVLREPLADLAEQVIASLAPDPLTLVLALAGAELRLARFAGSGWRTLTVESDGLLLDSFHLYQAADGTIAAFAVSDSQPRELVSFDVLDFESDEPVVGRPTGETLGARWLAAGSTLGGVVWAHGAKGWERLSATPEGWTWDKGPIVEPALDQVTAGATSDGSLYFAHAVDTGNFLDDLGAPFYRRLAPWQLEFAADVRGGISVDDYITSLTFKAHGRGFIIEYCGTDTDPFNVSGDAYRCYSSAHSVEGDVQLRGLKERDGARHAFTRDRVAVAYCNDKSELRVSIARELDPGAVIAWPCADTRRLEIDPNGAWLPVVSLDGNWRLITSSKHSSALPQAVGADSGADSGGEPAAPDAPDAPSGGDAGGVVDAGSPPNPAD